MRPGFETLGRSVTYIGPHGAGPLVRALNRVLVAVTYGAVGETLVLGAKSGINPSVTLDVLSDGLDSTWIVQVRRASFLEHSFDPPFRVDLHDKDVGIALAVAGGQTLRCL
jgi:2-hydroxy-3-oxopropionate reductase